MTRPADESRRSAKQLRADALAIWHAGLDAVRSERLIADVLQVNDGLLTIGDEQLSLDNIGRIVVVGAGKAGAGMAAAVEQQLDRHVAAEHHLTGWVNVPADCVAPLEHITLHPGREAGRNEPTEEGVQGTNKIVELIESLGPHDLCLCLISGGGSALLPAPRNGITLADKLAVTQFLSGAGANIAELNTVRRQLSAIKGGGLARRCRAGHLVSLIISDVIGDPLDLIASGPTVPGESTAHDALAVLDKFAAQDKIPQQVYDLLARQPGESWPAPTCQVTNMIIGNNARAVDAAGMEAERLGYSHAMSAARELEGAAETVGQHLARLGIAMAGRSGPDCLITGGEPVVTLVDSSIRGRGGRNQQLVLAAADYLGDHAGQHNLVILAGGTDGEDGPTDAAGAWIDYEQLRTADKLGLNRNNYLQRNDAYHYFEQLGTLIKTGPTQTNVCDLRVVVVDRVETACR